MIAAMTSVLRPDWFSLSPLIAILPELATARDLERFNNALFARYERVRAQRQDARGRPGRNANEAPAESNDSARELQRRMAAEEQMLRQVLEWLGVRVTRD